MTDEATHERLELSEADEDAYTRRREALHRAVTDLDRDLDAVAGEAEPDLGRFQEVIRALLANLQQHIDEAEASDGLLARIVEAAPWFAPRAEHLRQEHDEHMGRAHALLARAAGEADLTPLLAEARDLSHRLSQHRHRGTTLLMDTYMLDIPESD